VTITAVGIALPDLDVYALQGVAVPLQHLLLQIGCQARGGVAARAVTVASRCKTLFSLSVNLSP